MDFQSLHSKIKKLKIEKKELEEKLRDHEELNSLLKEGIIFIIVVSIVSQIVFINSTGCFDYTYV